MDGFSGFPNRLFEVNYVQSENYPNMMSIWYMKSTMSQGGFIYQENEWYKFTMTGSRDGDKCKQNLVIEGPGISSSGKWQDSATNPCLVLQEEYPLKAYTTKDLTYYREGTPIDGVVRNLAFMNSDTTIVSPCSEIEPTTTAAPEPPATTTAVTEPECGCYAPDEEISIENDKCIMNLGSFPDTEGDWSFTFDMKINSLPDEPTDPRWFFYILSGIGSFMTKLGTSENMSYETYFL